MRRSAVALLIAGLAGTGCYKQTYRLPIYVPPAGANGFHGQLRRVDDLCFNADHHVDNRSIARPIGYTGLGFSIAAGLIGLGGGAVFLSRAGVSTVDDRALVPAGVVGISGATLAAVGTGLYGWSEGQAGASRAAHERIEQARAVLDATALAAPTAPEYVPSESEIQRVAEVQRLCDSIQQDREQDVARSIATLMQSLGREIARTRGGPDRVVPNEPLAPARVPIETP